MFKYPGHVLGSRFLHLNEVLQPQFLEADERGLGAAKQGSEQYSQNK
jgi:hypothetical protein